MPDVARHKYNSGAAVEDLPREAQVIEAMTGQAVETAERVNDYETGAGSI